ncbi:hypothetical protein KIPB_002013 [Kipferlia bialata]|uniref:Uncharacterized protein n=1 Tax=Kipferlia bialata TaxID=797122 RepID=A0A9K3CPR8_9EUKA|nr:hypothetical protein KIPB_002013 [Kipferlia bialata]|eukprot:g2013.t1
MADPFTACSTPLSEASMSMEDTDSVLTLAASGDPCTVLFNDGRKALELAAKFVKYALINQHQVLFLRSEMPAVYTDSLFHVLRENYGVNAATAMIVRQIQLSGLGDFVSSSFSGLKLPGTSAVSPSAPSASDKTQTKTGGQTMSAFYRSHVVVPKLVEGFRKRVQQARDQKYKGFTLLLEYNSQAQPGPSMPLTLQTMLELQTELGKTPQCHVQFMCDARLIEHVDLLRLLGERTVFACHDHVVRIPEECQVNLTNPLSLSLGETSSLNSHALGLVASLVGQVKRSAAREREREATLQRVQEREAEWKRERQSLMAEVQRLTDHAAGLEYMCQDLRSENDRLLREAGSEDDLSDEEDMGDSVGVEQGHARSAGGIGFPLSREGSGEVSSIGDRLGSVVVGASMGSSQCMLGGVSSVPVSALPSEGEGEGVSPSEVEVGLRVVGAVSSLEEDWRTERERAEEEDRWGGLL